MCNVKEKTVKNYNDELKEKWYLKRTRKSQYKIQWIIKTETEMCSLTWNTDSVKVKVKGVSWINTETIRINLFAWLWNIEFDLYDRELHNLNVIFCFDFTMW